MQGRRATIQEARKASGADLEPILVVVLIPEHAAEEEDAQISNIEESCKLHYRVAPEHVR